MCIYISTLFWASLSPPIPTLQVITGWTPPFFKCCCSVTRLSPVLCDPVNCSTPGLPIPVSWSLLKLVSIESVMPSNHLILCYPLLLLPSIFPSIRVFSNELALCIRWPKYWSFSFGISHSNEYSASICFFVFHTGMFKLRDACGICWRSHCLVVILKNPIQILALDLLAFYPPTHLPSQNRAKVMSLLKAFNWFFSVKS